MIFSFFEPADLNEIMLELKDRVDENEKLLDEDLIKVLEDILDKPI